MNRRELLSLSNPNFGRQVQHIITKHHISKLMTTEQLNTLGQLKTIPFKLNFKCKSRPAVMRIKTWVTCKSIDFLFLFNIPTLIKMTIWWNCFTETINTSNEKAWKSHSDFHIFKSQIFLWSYCRNIKNCQGKAVGKYLFSEIFNLWLNVF